MTVFMVASYGAKALLFEKGLRYMLVSAQACSAELSFFLGPGRFIALFRNTAAFPLTRPKEPLYFSHFFSGFGFGGGGTAAFRGRDAVCGGRADVGI
jgi:hypothetical protein